MTGIRMVSLTLVTASFVMTGGSIWGQAQSNPNRRTPAEPLKLDKATAYYHYSLGHMYAELASAANNRGDYFTKAIENYRLAMKADPSAGFVSEELSDLYIQSGRLREAVTEAEDILRQNPADINSRRILARIYARLIGESSQQNRIDETYVKKAIEQYQKIAAQDPKDVDSWLMLGRLHKIARNSVESEKAYKKVLEFDADNEDALTGLAIVYSDLGDMKSASDALKRASEKHPNGRSLAALAQTYESMRDYALAAETLKKAVELTKGNVELKQALAQDLMLSDQLDESLKVYNEILAEDAKDIQSLLRISQIYRQKRDFAKAHEAAAKAKEVDPNNIEVRYNEVSLLEVEGRSAEALALMRDIVKSTQKKTYNAGERAARGRLIEDLGRMLRTAEQYPQAIETFQQMVEVDAANAGRASLEIVETYRQAKDFKRAEAEAQSALAKHPDNRSLRGLYASILADTGKSDQAITEVKKMLADKKDRETYIALAQVSEKAKRYTEMAQAIDEAEKLSDSKDDKETIYFMRGAMYEKMKKFDLAEAEFRKVLEMNPQNSSALNYLGYMFADRNIKLPEALQMITKALDREPGNPAYLDSLGWVFFRLGRLPEAETNLKASLEKMSKDPTVHDHLGDVYFKAGKVKDAIAQWEYSLKEWETTSAAEQEATEIAKIHKKLEGAKVRLARETKQ